MVMLSPAEEKRVKDYDQATAEQIRREREYAARPFKVTSLSPLLDALEAETLSGIKEAHSEIGLMLKCRETFRKSQAINDRVDYTVRMIRYQIEEDMEDVARWRSYQKELCRV
jgi:hypothetical protein